VPRTVIVWLPSDSVAVVNGDMHAANAPLSTWQAIAVASVTVNARVGVLSLVGFGGPLVIVTTGGVVSTLQLLVSVAVLPAASVACTVNWWPPSPRAEIVRGDVQTASGPPSRLHASATAPPPEVNAKVAVVELVAAGGPLVIATVGATVSIVQLNDAVAALPTGSVARTVKVWLPSARLLVSNAGVHATNAPPSTAHSNVAVASVEVNPKLAVALFDGSAGRCVIVTSGAVASTVQVRVTGDGSTCPVWSLARTVNVCMPSVSVNDTGDVHAANAPLSSLHSKVTGLSGEPNSNVTLAPVVELAAGPALIVVSGAVESTAHVALAGDGSRLPAASTARTL
jgi:hypothetical protein